MAPINPELFKKIHRIQIQTSHLVEDVLAGAYRSAFKGMGMEFEEVREYQAGDDVRTIDWNVSARMQKPYVKIFREEREITLTLIVDISASTRFGSGNQLKSDLIAEIAAVLAFSAIKNNDKVALILYSQTVEKYLPPKKGIRHVLRVIRELLSNQPQHPSTDLNAALTFLGKVQQRSGICFILSDFICPDYSHQAGIISRHHELISLALVDPAEKKFPKMDLTAFTDLETRKKLTVDTSTVEFQNHLKESCQQRLDTNRNLMIKLGADFCAIDTAQPYAAQLRKFFLLRQKRPR